MNTKLKEAIGMPEYAREALKLTPVDGIADVLKAKHPALSE